MRVGPDARMQAALAALLELSDEDLLTLEGLVRRTAELCPHDGRREALRVLHGVLVGALGLRRRKGPHRRRTKPGMPSA